MKKRLEVVYPQLRRLFILILPLAYYLLSRKNLLLLNAAILFIILFVMYLKYYLQIKVRPLWLNKIFVPERKFIFLSGACFLSILLFNKIIAINVMLFVILGNTLADIAREYNGRVKEILIFSYICLSCSLFILFFPLVFDWRIALLGCFSGVALRLIDLPINKDISVAVSSGVAMSSLLTQLPF